VVNEKRVGLTGSCDVLHVAKQRRVQRAVGDHVVRQSTLHLPRLEVRVERVLERVHASNVQRQQSIKTNRSYAQRVQQQTTTTSVLNTRQNRSPGSNLHAAHGTSVR
jgi:hypothetical protein